MFDLPALWGCFLVTIGLLLLFREIFPSTFLRGDFWGWVVRQVSFFQFGTPDILRHWGDGQVNQDLWTISIELQFYILVPFLYYIMKRFDRRWPIGWTVLLLGSIAMCSLLTCLPDGNIVRRLIPLCVITYLFAFLFGIAFYRYWGRFILRRRTGVLLACGILWFRIGVWEMAGSM